MKASIRQAAAVAALGAALFGMASAQAAGAPPMQKIDGIEVMSGGIGDGEAAAIQSEARHWPLTLEFAIKDKARSDYAADVNVTVRDAKGHTVLQTTSGGPFLLARLNPGPYTVQASLDGKTLQQKVMVGHQPARHLFLWPAGTDESAS
ncbi:MAG: carboxypeptidase-like regulatory domain-containing protein [Rhodoferax sp.]|nr:carboxypeptidase-like regulatory domain-containing protein [Rhodoferax sp.]